MAGIRTEPTLTRKVQQRAMTAFCVAVRGSASAGPAVLPAVIATRPVLRTATLAFVLPEVIESVRSGAGQQPDGTHAAVARGAQAGDGLRVG